MPYKASQKRDFLLGQSTQLSNWVADRLKYACICISPPNRVYNSWRNERLNGHFCSKNPKNCPKMAFPNPLTNFLVGGGLKLFGFAFYSAQILSGDRSQVGQFKSWIRKKLRFLGHPILQSRENKMKVVFFILVGSILLLSAKKRTERLSNNGLIQGGLILTVQLQIRYGWIHFGLNCPNSTHSGLQIDPKLDKKLAES